MKDVSKETNAERRPSRTIDFDVEPEIMLPWYVNGTLSVPEHQMFTRWMASRRDLQQMLVEEVRLQAVVQAEPSESLDVEAGIRRLAADLKRLGWGNRDRRAAAAGRHWLAGAADRFWRNLARDLAGLLSVRPAPILAVACVLQFAIIGMFAWTIYEHGGAPFVTLSESPRTFTGPRGIVSFAPGASIAEISQFLSAHQVAVVSGPNTLGMFEVQARTGSGRGEHRATEDALKLKALLASRPDLIDMVLDGRD